MIKGQDRQVMLSRPVNLLTPIGGDFPQADLGELCSIQHLNDKQG